ncbi:MAG TPA: S8 family serine peptidase, partial [Bacteroidota bacterium]|nr:S8 family serine peptidase [Bacteroidota bacterium]
WVTEGTTWSNGLTTTLNGGDVNETVGMPATASGAISVGGYVTKWLWPTYSEQIYGWVGTDRTSNICDFSSIGPTRDGRQKPDVAAPGMGIASSLSLSSDTTGQAGAIYPGQKDIVFAGTSFATPHVVGTAALILGAFPSATADQIKSLITSSARTDAFTGSVPNVTWGYGKLDAAGAMAKQFSSSAVVTRTLHAYDGSNANLLLSLTGSAKFAVRITPTVSGQLTGILLNLTTAVNNPVTGTGSIICEVYSNNGGLPGTKLGSSVMFPLQRLLPAPAPNYIQMVGAGVNVTQGNDVHLVVSIANPSETVLIRSENVTTGTRSSSFNGSVWSAVATNHRIEAIVTSVTGLSAVNPAPTGVPITYGLQQNYPNPFNPSTEIDYSIAQHGMVSLKVFDILGREVATLVNQQQNAGSYRITWTGRNMLNQPVTSGVYFYRLESGSFTKTNKMILLK